MMPVVVVTSSEVHLRMSDGKSRGNQPRDNGKECRDTVTSQDVKVEVKTLHLTHRETRVSF